MLPVYYTETAMTLYHGGYAAVESPNLGLSRKNLDFGAGFYTTESKTQAGDFARKVMIRYVHSFNCAPEPEAVL